MITHKFESHFDWMEFRRGRFSGSRVKDVLVKKGTKMKKTYYEVIAERLGITPGDEECRERGNRLEADAVAQFEKKTGKKVNTDLVMWCRDDNEHIAVSPDGVISETEALEIKCLASSSHLEAYVKAFVKEVLPRDQAIPSEYRDQAIQYFIVNESLQTLYFCMYDPRFGEMDCAFFILEMHRKDVEEEIAEYLEQERTMLAEIDAIVNNLIQF